jgi:hypothetical protein
MAERMVPLTGETWKPVARNPSLYAVSSLGRVCNIQRGRLLSQRDVSENGYKRVGIHGAGGGQRTVPVHHLVCEAFHGPRPEGQYAAHINGDAGDNRAENLRWATPWENSQDRIRHGTAPRGSGHKRAKLNEAAVAALRALNLAIPLNYQKLADAIGIDRTSLTDAIDGKKWTHVPMPDPKGKP